MVYYSAEARGYALMMALRARLDARAAGGRRRRPRALVGRLRRLRVPRGLHALHERVRARRAAAWLLWAHPEARRPALLANAGAAVAFLPWLGGLQRRPRRRRRRTSSPRCRRSRGLRPDEPRALGDRLSVRDREHADPGAAGGAGAGAARARGLAALAGSWRPGAAARARGRRLDRRLVLLVVLAVSVPLGTAVASAVGSNIFGTRNLAASWPAFALCLAAFLVAGGPRLGLVAAALAIAAFAIGAVKLLGPDFRRPDFQARRGGDRPRRRARRRRRRRRSVQPRRRAGCARRRARAAAPALLRSAATRSSTTRSGSSRPPRRPRT